MIRILSIIAVLGLTGCATASNTYLKNGKQGLSIDCSGEAMSWASCYEKADASCAGTGYEIVGASDCLTVSRKCRLQRRFAHP